jgi:hypothetical protein
LRVNHLITKAAPVESAALQITDETAFVNECGPV